ncbi:MAG: 50S ribosomal protein L18 [Candidatus Dependentiae bacterium]|nr:50S ribosomal protein L18 [Candidatus Dependentiae bacterium]
MSFEKKQKARIKRRVLRVRSTLKQNILVPKVSVFRSLKHIYAQIVDMTLGKTVASCSSLELDATGSKKEIARSVGLELAKRAKDQGISTVIFDRGRYLYHGRVQELSDGLREGGLKV